MNNIWRPTISYLEKLNNERTDHNNKYNMDFHVRRRFHYNTSTEELCNILLRRPPVYVFEWINWLNIILNFYQVNRHIVRFLTQVTVDLYYNIRCKKKQYKCIKWYFVSIYDEPLPMHHYLKSEETLRCDKAYEQLEVLRNWNFENFMRNVPKRSRA